MRNAASNLAAPVLSGMLLEALVNKASMETYGKVRGTWKTTASMPSQALMHASSQEPFAIHKHVHICSLVLLMRGWLQRDVGLSACPWGCNQ
jgi:hypothetical protein